MREKRIGSIFHSDNVSESSRGDTVFGNLAATTTLQSTILASSDPASCSGTFTSGGYNLSDDESCNLVGEGDINDSQDIHLGPLQDNGGPTETMRPLDGSAAIDAISPQDCLTFSTEQDQRGLLRPQGAGCEIGAVELEGTAACANRATGQLTGLLANGTCPSTSVPLLLPSPDPVTFCINRSTGAIIWSARGNCSPATLVHVIPDDGPLSYCQHIYTGALRYTRTGKCSAPERAGVIPGL